MKLQMVLCSWQIQCGEPRNPLQEVGPVTLIWWHQTVSKPPSCSFPPPLSPFQLWVLTQQHLIHIKQHNFAFTFFFQHKLQGFLFEYIYLCLISNEKHWLRAELKFTLNSCPVESALRIPIGYGWSGSFVTVAALRQWLQRVIMKTYVM